jgi:DNA-binding MarR family transcriptional regulator
MDSLEFCRTLFEETRYMNLTIKEALDVVISQHGLNHFQVHLLGELRSLDGQPIRSLASHICVKPSNITPLIRSLEELGYVERKQDAADKRSFLIFLTEKGRKTSEAIDRDFSNLFDAEREHADELQQKVIEGLEAFRELTELNERFITFNASNLDRKED